MHKSTISSRRETITAILLLFAVGGGLLRWLAPQPSLARDMGSLLLVLWLPIIGNIIAYWMNSRIIFKENLTLSRYVRFFISYLPNYIIQNIIVIIFYNLLGFPSIVSYLIAAVLGIPVTFLMVKIFAFGRK